MLLAGEVKGELARIQPARACCRRAELIGLLHGSGGDRLRTLDHATARTAVHLATSLRIGVEGPRGATPTRTRRPRTRHHLAVRVDGARLGAWRWAEAPACDRRSFLRGVLLGSGSISLTPSGPHVEFVMRSADAATTFRALLAEMGVRAGLSERRGQHVVYIKGQEEIVALLGLMGANRGVLQLETQIVERDVRSRLNRLLNAEEANLGRTVEAADRQLAAIDRLEREGMLARLSPTLRETATTRRRMPDADLDALASTLGVSRSAVNHRLRRIVELAREKDE